MGVASYIPAPPTFIFRIALLKILYLEQVDQVPTSTKRPRQVSDIIAKVAPKGHTP